MTLVIALMISNLPVILGDILLSGPELDKSISIPTIDDIYEIFPKGSAWSITNLKQKVNIINDNLIIGWAGSCVAARVIISELKTRSTTQPFTKNSLESFFIEVNGDINTWIAKQEVSFIGWIKDTEKFYPFSYSFNGALINEIESPKYGKIKICGSGTDDMKELLEKVSRPSQKSSNSRDFDNVIIESLTFCGWFFADEMSTSRSLRQYYGGAYEIATYVKEEKKFKKIDDITYLTWIVQDINTEPKINLVNKIFKVSYLNDVLLVYAIEFNLSSELIPTVYNSEEYIKYISNNITLYRVFPVNINSIENKVIKISKEEEETLELDSEFNFNYLFPVSIENGKASWAGSVICKPLRLYNKKSNSIRFISEDKQLSLIVKYSDFEYLRNTFNASTNS